MLETQIFSPKAETGNYSIAPLWSIRLSLYYPILNAKPGMCLSISFNTVRLLHSTSSHLPFIILPCTWVLNSRIMNLTSILRPAFRVPFRSSSVNSTPVIYCIIPDSLGQSTENPFHYHSLWFSMLPIQN